MPYGVLFILFSITAATWGQGTSSMTIIDYLTTNRYTLFLRYLQQAGLIDILNGTGPFTVFGPPNPFFYHLEAIRNDTAKVTNVMKYQVATGLHKADDMSINENQLESLQGSKIRLNHYYSVGKVTAEGKAIFAKDYVMSNGIMHFLTGAMFPPIGTVLDVISSDGGLSTLLSAVQSVGLDSFLQNQEPITMFTPTDKAFASLGSDKLQALRSNHTLLTSVLKYHVIPGTLYAVGYHPDYLHTFQEIDRIRLQRYSHGFEVDDGRIDNNELSATNGVVHKIDHVLIPLSLIGQI